MALSGSVVQHLIGIIERNKEIIIENENILFLLNEKYAILKKQ